MAKYDYVDTKNLDEAATVEHAVRTTVINYFRQQLGWSSEKCEQRVEIELNREIPKAEFNTLENRRGWHLDGATLLDVGAGQGGAVLEALHRGANAYGVEPGEEFSELSRRRLKEAGFSADRIYQTGGETLPFPDEHFDYAISLQVLEHVEDPRSILEEMYRVLKPGGKALINCENYLAFREQHYRIPWFPLLPKSLGSIYLRAIGRDPSFLKNYVFYSTYPQIWRLVSAVGFWNTTYQRRLAKARSLEGIQSESSSIMATVFSVLPASARMAIARWGTHALNVFKSGVRIHATKPRDLDPASSISGIHRVG